MIEQVEPDRVAGVETLFADTRYALRRVWLKSLSECSREGCLFAVREQGRVRAALACWRQNPDVFVLCGAAFAEEDDIPQAFPPLLERLAEHARGKRASMLTFVGIEEWLLPFIVAAGFVHSDDVITLLKTGREVPSPTTDEVLQVRPAREADIDVLTALDAAAFPSVWHYGYPILYDALLSAGSFLTAEGAGLVGYAYGDVQGRSAHLTRLVVSPDHRGRGVGAMLLSAVLRAFYRQGVRLVTLNTQKSNTASQRLYQRFGFQPIGQAIPLLVYPLSEAGARSQRR